MNEDQREERNCDKCGVFHKNEYKVGHFYKGFTSYYFLCIRCFEQQTTFVGQYFNSGLK